MPTPIYSSALLLLLVIRLFACGNALSPTDRPGAVQSKRSVAQPTMGRHLKADGVRDFGQVTPTLYRGGQPSAEGFETLAHMGIAIIIDTGRSTRDQKLVESLGMTYISLPWYCPFPKDKVFDRFIEIIRKNPGKKIFVHCRFGDDRTGMMIAAYRMAEDHWTAKQAQQEMREFGYTPIHHLMCPGLGRYETSFPRRLRTDPVFDNLH
jgi:tyrosine-protein phosphatase SIW14